MRNRFVLFFTGCLAILLSSCLGSENEERIEIAPNCLISNFTLAHDSVSALKSTIFTIDQVNGLIYNSDSLPYGTKIDKVVATVTYASPYSISAVQVAQEIYPDSIAFWNNSDSLNFAKPVVFKITAFDAITKKDYIASVNIHKVMPDTMVWNEFGTIDASKDMKTILVSKGGQKSFYTFYSDASNNYKLKISALPTSETSIITNGVESMTGLPSGLINIDQIAVYEDVFYVSAGNGDLYSSENGYGWSKKGGAPKIVTLLGVVKESQTAGVPSAMAAIINKGGQNIFASMNKDGEWTDGSSINSEFPVSGFASISYNSMLRERLLLVGGRTSNNNLTNRTWATMDGISWFAINDRNLSFEGREGMVIAEYDMALYLIGGMDAEGNVYKDVYSSISSGMTWNLNDSLFVMPESYAPRAFSSIAVDDDMDYMYIFGGRGSSNSNMFTDVWRGRINRLGFGKEY